MPTLVVTNSKGDEKNLEAQPGKSLMEVMRDGGIKDLAALCNGSCSCATCHVWVAPEFLPRLAPMSGQESDMLDCVEERRENSRLSCQIKMTAALDGIRVTVAPA